MPKRLIDKLREKQKREKEEAAKLVPTSLVAEEILPDASIITSPIVEDVLPDIPAPIPLIVEDVLPDALIITSPIVEDVLPDIPAPIPLIVEDIPSIVDGALSDVKVPDLSVVEDVPSDAPIAILSASDDSGRADNTSRVLHDVVNQEEVDFGIEARVVKGWSSLCELNSGGLVKMIINLPSIEEVNSKKSQLICGQDEIKALVVSPSFAGDLIAQKITCSKSEKLSCELKNGEKTFILPLDETGAGKAWQISVKNSARLCEIFDNKADSTVLFSSIESKSYNGVDATISLEPCKVFGDGSYCQDDF